MKILEEKKLKGLKKEFLVEIPFSDLDDLKQKKLKDISEKVKNIQDGVRMASDTLLSGKTKELIETLKVAKTSLQ